MHATTLQDTLTEQGTRPLLAGRRTLGRVGSDFPTILARMPAPFGRRRNHAEAACPPVRDWATAMSTPDPAVNAGTHRRDLPTGVVTFLFSDIEGSTRLLQSLGDRFPALLERQARLMRDAIAAGDGIEVGTEGDSFFVVFPSPGGAVEAAVAAQRALADAAWPDGASVKVRIGIHTGEGDTAGTTTSDSMCTGRRASPPPRTAGRC